MAVWLLVVQCFGTQQSSERREAGKRLGLRESHSESRSASAMARRAGLALLAVMVRQVIGAAIEWTLEPEDASPRRELLQPAFLDDAFLADSFQSPVRAPGCRWRATQRNACGRQAAPCPV